MDTDPQTPRNFFLFFSFSWLDLLLVPSWPENRFCRAGTRPSSLIRAGLSPKMLKFCKFPHVGADQKWNFASYEWSFVFWRILNLRGRWRSKILTKLRHLAQKICHFRHNWPNTAVNCPTRRAYDRLSIPRALQPRPTYRMEVPWGISAKQTATWAWFWRARLPT